MLVVGNTSGAILWDLGSFHQVWRHGELEVDDEATLSYVVRIGRGKKLSCPELHGLSTGEDAMCI